MAFDNFSLLLNQVNHLLENKFFLISLNVLLFIKLLLYKLEGTDGMLRRPTSSSCLGLWARLFPPLEKNVPFYAVLALFRPNYAFSINLSIVKKI